ncbi:MAG: autotransporter outer membrane beta-barrel domain-containing protein [Cupriavidus sp.]|nr:autotransporter outer membrane beta-barrel domain-containing protein [Cupriavidus sp.]NUT14289.1 autotransporter outer membrane beta-barrel domain-containing protein [Cupriavidus sp.]
MTVVLSSAREREAGTSPGWHGCAAHPGIVHHPMHCCAMLAMLMCALAHADEGLPDFHGASGSDPPLQASLAPAGPAEPAQVSGQPAGGSEASGWMVQPLEPVVVEYAAVPAPSSSPSSSPLPRALGAGPDDDAPGLAAVDRETAAMPERARRLSLHLDDITTASGFADNRVRTMALAVDAVVPRTGGLTIQPRLQLAYQPGTSADPNKLAQAMPGDASATGIGVRLYGAQPTRLAGIYPFVEADWWQDSRKQVININGTKIDADLLRGLFSFNIGAHGNTKTGMKLWFKVRAGRSPSGTVGARYRW